MSLPSHSQALLTYFAALTLSLAVCIAASSEFVPFTGGFILMVAAVSVLTAAVPATVLSLVFWGASRLQRTRYGRELTHPILAGLAAFLFSIAFGYLSYPAVNGRYLLVFGRAPGDLFFLGIESVLVQSAAFAIGGSLPTPLVLRAFSRRILHERTPGSPQLESDGEANELRGQRKAGVAVACALAVVSAVFLQGALSSLASRQQDRTLFEGLLVLGCTIGAVVMFLQARRVNIESKQHGALAEPGREPENPTP